MQSTPTRSGEGTRGRGVAQPEQRVCGGGLCEAPRVCVGWSVGKRAREEAHKGACPTPAAALWRGACGRDRGQRASRAVGAARHRQRARNPDKGCAARVVPRLFVCSVASGAFNVDEVAQFSQDDLDAEDAVILDAHSTVFVWIGARSHPAEQKLAMDTAVDCCCVCAAKCDPQPPTPCAVPARGAVRGAHHVHHKLPRLAGQATGRSNKERHPEPEQSASSADTAQR